MAPIPAQAKLTKSQFVGNLTNELISKKTPQEIIQIRYECERNVYKRTLWICNDSYTTFKS